MTIDSSLNNGSVLDTGDTDLAVGSTFADVSPELLEALSRRAAVVEHTTGSEEALLGAGVTGAFTRPERLALAWYAASLQSSPHAGYYAALLRSADPGLAAAVTQGEWPEALAPAAVYARGLTLTASAVGQEDVDAFLAVYGGSEPLVVVSMIVSFVSYQIRMIAGLRAIDGLAPSGTPVPDPLRMAQAHGPYVRAELDWTERATPLDLADADEVQLRGLKLTSAESPYFRLLALTPAGLVERTLTDHAIFRLPGGLPRGERELGALVSSMVNGCVFCASVHARFSAVYSKRPGDIDTLLALGLYAPLDERWRAIVDAAAALAQPTPSLTAEHIERLRALSLDTLALVDLIGATAFFAWANRLMLSLGDPVYPADYALPVAGHAEEVGA